MLGHNVDLLAYGPVPGMELFPYFLALLGWIVLAVLGVLFSPVMRLIRRLRGRKADPPSEGKREQQAQPSEAVAGDSQPSAG